jgi:hypothetical protein
MFASSRLSETGGGIHRRRLKCAIDAALSLLEKCRRFRFLCAFIVELIAGARPLAHGAGLELRGAGSRAGINFMRVEDAR